MKFTEIILTSRVNKRNGQINLTPKKKELDKETLDRLSSNKPIKFLLSNNE